MMQKTELYTTGITIRMNLLKHLILLFLLLSTLNLFSQDTESYPDSLPYQYGWYLEEKPHYPEGKKALREWFQANIHCPEILADSNYQLKIYCRVIIDTLGKIAVTQTVCKNFYDSSGRDISSPSQSSVNSALTREIKQAFSQLPPLIPGRHIGKKRFIECFFSFRFTSLIKLENADKSSDPFTIVIFPAYKKQD